MNRFTTVLAYGALVVFCFAVGVGLTFYGDWVSDKLVRIVLLPGVLLLVMLFFADKAKLFLLLILVRVAIDPVIEATRDGSLSAGALMNLLILLIGVLMFAEKPRVVSGIVLPMWAPVVAVMMLGALRSPDVGKAVRVFLGYMTSVAVFMAPFYIERCRKNLSLTIWLVLWSSVVPTFYGFIDYAHGGMGGVNGNRVSSVFAHANIFAFYLVVVISLAFYMVKSKVLALPWYQRWLLLGYIGVMLINLLLTQTRSAWAACVVFFVAYGLLFERKYFLYIVGAGMLAMLIPDVRDRVLEINSAKVYWNNNMPSNSYEWRKTIWREGLEFMSLSSYPLGYGSQSFAYYSREFFSLANGGNWGAHSVYVQWFFEAGIVGVLAVAWLYLRIGKLLRHGLAGDRLGTFVVLSVIIEYLVVCYSDNMLDYLAFNWYYWFVVGTACAIAVNQQAEEGARFADTQPAPFGGRVPSVSRVGRESAT